MNQTNLEGSFLVAMPRMGDARFENSVIFVCAHSAEGAMGFIVNRPMGEVSIEEFFVKLEIVTESERGSLPDRLAGSTLHNGGPVEPGRGFVLHSPDYRGSGTIRVNEDVCLTATLEILRSIVAGKGPRDYMLALGYSGWSSGQLEDEIAANGWLVTHHAADIVFGGGDDSKYSRVMGAMGIDPVLLSADSGHA